MPRTISAANRARLSVEPPYSSWAPVVKRREELRHLVRVRAVDFDPVHPRAPRARRARGVAVDQAADILRRKIVDVLNGISPSGLEFRRVELAKELCAMLVRDVGQTFPSGDIAVVGEGWAAWAHFAVWAAGMMSSPTPPVRAPGRTLSSRR